MVGLTNQLMAIGNEFLRIIEINEVVMCRSTFCLATIVPWLISDSLHNSCVIDFKST